MKISFPDEQFTAKWRQTLLADLKRRIREVGGSPGSHCMLVGQAQTRLTVFCCAEIMDGHGKTVALIIKIAIAVINHVLEAQKLGMKTYHDVFLVSGSSSLARFKQFPSLWFQNSGYKVNTQGHRSKAGSCLFLFIVKKWCCPGSQTYRPLLKGIYGSPPAFYLSCGIP